MTGSHKRQEKAVITLDGMAELCVGVSHGEQNKSKELQVRGGGNLTDLFKESCCEIAGLCRYQWGKILTAKLRS